MWEINYACERWYCLFNASSLLLHSPFTASSLPRHCLFTASSLPLHCLFTACSLSLHCLFTSPSLPLHCLCTASALPLSSLPLHCCPFTASSSSLPPHCLLTASSLPPHCLFTAAYLSLIHRPLRAAIELMEHSIISKLLSLNIPTDFHQSPPNGDVDKPGLGDVELEVLNAILKDHGGMSPSYCEALAKLVLMVEDPNAYPAPLRVCTRSVLWFSCPASLSAEELRSETLC
jgi:hypothetical protein